MVDRRSPLEENVALGGPLLRVPWGQNGAGRSGRCVFTRAKVLNPQANFNKLLYFRREKNDEIQKTLKRTWKNPKWEQRKKQKGFEGNGL